MNLIFFFGMFFFIFVVFFFCIGIFLQRKEIFKSLMLLKFYVNNVNVKVERKSWENGVMENIKFGEIVRFLRIFFFCRKVLIQKRSVMKVGRNILKKNIRFMLMVFLLCWRLYLFWQEIYLRVFYFVVGNIFLVNVNVYVIIEIMM